MLKKHTSALVRLFSSYLLLEISSLIKINHIFGSNRVFFSGINCTGPLMRYFNSLGALVLFLLRQFITKNLFFKAHCLQAAYTFHLGIFNPLAYHIPTLFASTYWFSNNAFIRCMLPLLCIGAFTAHPIGYHACYYSWFWFIPMIIHCLPFQTPFLEALGTTFLAHALGSVLYLYIQPMPAEYWIGLMPVVMIERLLFASGITITYYAINFINTFFKFSILKNNSQSIPA